MKHFKFDFDTKTKIHQFEEIGMTDPFTVKTNIDQALKVVDGFNFDNEVYPKAMVAALL